MVFIWSYNSHMETTSISNLKTHLSAVLKQVVKGVHFVVMDRNHPVARLEPFLQEPKLIIRPPVSKHRVVKNKFKGHLKTDPVEVLQKDRGGRF